MKAEANNHYEERFVINEIELEVESVIDSSNSDLSC